jgi:hypothetical protein
LLTFFGVYTGRKNRRRNTMRGSVRVLYSPESKEGKRWPGKQEWVWHIKASEKNESIADKNREAIRWRWATYLLGRGTAVPTGSESELSTVNVSMIRQCVVVSRWSTAVVWVMPATMMVAQGRKR